MKRQDEKNRLESLQNEKLYLELCVSGMLYIRNVI